MYSIRLALKNSKKSVKIGVMSRKYLADNVDIKNIRKLLRQIFD